MHLTTETTVLTVLRERSGSNTVTTASCLLSQRLPALAGVAAAGATALAFGVHTQLDAKKLCSPLEGKTRHRFLQQMCLNHLFYLPQSLGLVYRLKAVILPSALKSDARPGPIFCHCS